ncbi:IS4 family transposase [Streptomyces sp. NPDC004728]|uniref:IS4 family transposase n=1 Tax=Streptomyces sp. NPDC004728 TaxID=3154289 RepID=UPI0033B375AD
MKSSGERLSDRIALGVLTRVFPPELVDEVVVGCGRLEQRSRLLPARVVVYFVLAMCLFSGQGYEEVARLLTQGLERVRRWEKPWRVPTAAAIGRARRRLGPEPLKVLFARVCRPVAAPDTAGAWYRRWRLVAVDGTVFDVPDTGANSDFFGRPGSVRGQQRSAYPQVRVAALVECGTHAVFAVATGPLSVHEQQLIPGLLGRLEPGILLMADRGITGFELWPAASDMGADLLWRVRKNIVLPVLEAFDDGSVAPHPRYTSVRFTEHLSIEGIRPSIGSVGDAYDNALMETINGLYKAECIRTKVFHDGPWRTVSDVEYATTSWVEWYNNRRLHSSLGMISPTEFEAAHYADTEPRAD